MDHSDIRHKLSEYLDGSVTPEEKSAIDAHLRTCEECANALTELGKTIEAIKQIEEVETPAWMTSKIMAKVRAEQEAKKNLWQRLFYPLGVKLPIQAIAVLCLTITVYYIYTAPPPEKFSEAPVGQLSKEEASPAAPSGLERKEPEVVAPRRKKAEQAPGYKSLDMKYAYEKPAAPVPAEKPAKAAPVPAGEAYAPLMAKDEATVGTGPATPRTNAAAPSSLMAAQETSVRSQAGTDKEKRSLVPRTAAPLTSEAPSTAAGAAADTEADAFLAVIERFSQRDLPDRMKVKGLTFSVRKYRSDQPDLQWLPKMAAYRSHPCADRYIVDIELSGQLSKYLYCHDRSGVRLLGVFEHRNGTWTENK